VLSAFWENEINENDISRKKNKSFFMWKF